MNNGSVEARGHTHTHTHFQAVFKFQGKQIYVGVYDSLLKAAVAADYRCVDLGFQRAKLFFSK